MIKKIIIIGGATQDIFIDYKNQEMLHLHTQQKQESFLILKEGHKIEVDNINYATGGGATNSTVSFKRLGLEPSIICKIGKDKQGEYIIKTLQKETINTNMIVETNNIGTGISFIVPSPSGDRSLFAYRGANISLNLKDISLKNFDNTNQLYITSLSGKASQLLLELAKKAHQKNIPVATNPGSSQLAAGAKILCKALPYIDTLILNSDEAKLLMSSLIKSNNHLQTKNNTVKKNVNLQSLPNLLQAPIFYENISFNIPSFFTEIHKRGPTVIVITNGPEGVYVSYKNFIYFHPSIKTQVVNTLGAGDAFSSCFVAMMAQKKPLETAITYGIINASSVINYLDAKTGLLDEKTLINKAKALPKGLIQKYPLK